MNYKHCDCRDCMELVLGVAMCGPCQEAGCAPHEHPRPTDVECRREDAYGNEE